MDRVAFSHKNRFKIILFVIFSVIFILSGIPSVHRESLLYGDGYFMSETFLKTFLGFIPFVLCTLYFVLLSRRKYVVILDENGICDQRYLFGKVFIPWEKIESINFSQDGKKDRLIINLRQLTEGGDNIINEQKGITYKIPLKSLDYREDELRDFLLYHTKE